MKHWEGLEGLREAYRELVKQVSEGLASYLQVEDWSEEGDPDYKVSLGNLPMPCPGCGRMRLNFHPDLCRIDCEKCFWTAGQIYPGDEGEFARVVERLDAEDLKEISRILTAHAESCRTYNCESEAESTQRIADRLKGLL